MTAHETTDSRGQPDVGDPALLAAIFEAATQAILVADDERRYVAANPAACEILGRSIDEILAMRVDDLAPAGARRWVEQAWAQFIVDGTQSGPMEILRPDGTVRYVDYDARASIQPGLHVSLLRDVTSRVLTERALRERLEREAEARYREAFGTLESSVVILRALRGEGGELIDETIEYANPAWCREIVGDDAADATGLRLVATFPAFAVRLEIHRQVIETGEPYRGVMTIPGGQRWFDVEYVRFGDGVIALSREVTDRVEAEQRLATSEATFRAAFEENPETIGVLRPVFDSDGRFIDAEALFANRAVRDRYLGGLADEEVRGSLVLARWPGLRPLYESLWRRAAEERVAISEEVHVTVERGEFWTGISIFPFADGFVMIGRDRSAEHRALEALRESEARYHETVETLLDPLVILRAVRDEAGAIVDFVYEYANEAACVSNRVTRDELVGRSLVEFLPGHEGAGLLASYRRVIETGEPLVLDDYAYRDRWGGELMDRVFDIRAHKLGDALVYMWRDVTAQRALADQLARGARLESLGRLASGVAHDFNNLLYGVSLIAGSIAAHPGNPDVPAEAGEIVDAVAKGQEMTRALLTFARGGSSERRWVDPAPFVRETVELLERLLGASIAIRTDLPDGLPEIHVDTGGLTQALINLAVNARDAMPEGGTLRISLRETVLGEAAAVAAGTTPGRYVGLSVEDTGVGIAPEVIGRIFEPFFSTKPANIGTGLGLAVTYGFVHANGGGIAVESAPGHGTTFRLYLPVV